MNCRDFQPHRLLHRSSRQKGATLVVALVVVHQESFVDAARHATCRLMVMAVLHQAVPVAAGAEVLPEMDVDSDPIVLPEMDLASGSIALHVTVALVQRMDAGEAHRAMVDLVVLADQEEVHRVTAALVILDE